MAAEAWRGSPFSVGAPCFLSMTAILMQMHLGVMFVAFGRSTATSPSRNPKKITMDRGHTNGLAQIPHTRIVWVFFLFFEGGRIKLSSGRKSRN